MTEPTLYTDKQIRTTKILTVSELNRLANQVLTQSFPLFWVSGEVSNLTRVLAKFIVDVSKKHHPKGI